MKMIIVGSGATAYSKYANPDFRPPMTNKSDFQRIVYSFALPDFWRKFKIFFLEAFDLYQGDVEQLFTDIYILLSPEFEEELTEQSRALLALLERLSLEKRVDNLFTLFAGKLREAIQRGIGTSGAEPVMPVQMPVCLWHRRIFSSLVSGDVVVNFNYDLIVPFALLSEKKLSQQSFSNSNIERVEIEARLTSTEPVSLIAPHGSFCWYDLRYETYLTKNGMHFAPGAEDVYRKYCGRRDVGDAELGEVNSRLNFTKILVNLKEHLPKMEEPPFLPMSSVILPFKKKPILLDKFPILKEEYSAFLDALRLASEVVLIGKQFKGADEDIASDIREICSQSGEKKISYADPNVDDGLWLEYHNQCFNAKVDKKYRSLEEMAAAE